MLCRLPFFIGKVKHCSVLNYLSLSMFTCFNIKVITGAFKARKRMLAVTDLLKQFILGLVQILQLNMKHQRALVDPFKPVNKCAWITANNIRIMCFYYPLWQRLGDKCFL